MQIHSGKTGFDAVAHTAEVGAFGEPLAEHEDRYHVGARLQQEARRVERLGARLRERLDVRRQSAQLYVHREFETALSGAEVAQRVN